MLKKLFLPTVIALAGSTVAMAAEEAHEADPSVFAGTIAQSIAAIIVFLLLFSLLYKMAWGPILKGLQEREAKIKGDLHSAEAAAQKAAATLAEYQAKLATAQAEVMKIMDQGRIDAQKLADSIKTQTQEEITATRQRAQADIRTAKEQALAEIYATTATLATDVAGKILQRQINEQDQERLVHESLAELRGR